MAAKTLSGDVFNGTGTGIGFFGSDGASTISPRTRYFIRR